MQSYKPHHTLVPYIECYWSWRVEPLSPELDPILPDAAPEFIVHLGKVPRILKEEGNWQQQPQSYLYCAAHRSVRLIVEGSINMFAVRFRPWGVARFSDGSMADFIDREVLPDEAFGNLGLTLHEKIAMANDDEGRVIAANTVLGGALHRHRERSERLEQLGILVNGGQSKGSDIAKSLCMSERSFRRLWHDAVGIEQRKFASLMRFHRAVSLIDAGCQLADVAQECGYSDQPHLARDIKSISGLQPSLLRKRLGADVYQSLYVHRPAAPWHPGSKDQW